jgi:hypothetical protein
MKQPPAQALDPAPTTRAAAPPVGESLPIAELAVARLAAATMSRSVSALLSETLAAVETPAATAIGRIYLESVAVTDYRGIGDRTWFRLAPRPGVTLVVGRNGAGKSSLAEALETAFTGTNSRWERQDDARRGNWRNLRAGATPKVEVKLSVAGDAGLGQLTRTWPADDFETSSGMFKRHGHAAVPAGEAPWAGALSEYRPFLSYADLGNLISDKASRQYDAVDRILGLGYLVEVDTLLKAEQSRLTAAAKRADEGPPRTGSSAACAPASTSVPSISPEDGHQAALRPVAEWLRGLGRDPAGFDKTLAGERCEHGAHERYRRPAHLRSRRPGTTHETDVSANGWTA